MFALIEFDSAAEEKERSCRNKTGRIQRPKKKENQNEKSKGNIQGTARRFLYSLV